MNDKNAEQIIYPVFLRRSSQWLSVCNVLALQQSTIKILPRWKQHSFASCSQQNQYYSTEAQVLSITLVKALASISNNSRQISLAIEKKYNNISVCTI